MSSKDFVKVARVYHGGFPDKTDFDFVDSKGHAKTGCMAQLVSMDLKAESNILKIKEWLGDQLPPGLVPFGDDGGGDFICLDYRASGERQKIAYWSHEAVLAESVIGIANTFSDFLDKLREPND